VTAWQRRFPLALIVISLVGLVAFNTTTGTPSIGRPSPGQPSSAPSVTPWPETGFTNPTPRMAIVYDASGRGSAGFNELAWEGATRAAARFDAELEEVSADPDDTEADRVARLVALADARYTPIFVIGSAYAAAVAAVAPKYPGTWFGLLDDGSVNAPNVIGMLFNEEQGAYLVGAAAALTSKTGKVGFIGSVQTPLLKKYEAGFSAGARAANPRVKVQVVYLSRTLGDADPIDPPAARKAALRMYDAGADVIFAAADDASGGVFRAATDRGLWAIGADSDQYLTSDPSVRGAIVTSMLKRADVATFTITMEVATGVPKDGNNVFGLDRDGVGYAASGGFVDPIKAQLDAFADRIAAGEILVPTKP